MLGQIIVEPTVTPSLNNGGWVYNAAILLAAVGFIIALLLVFAYMRFAPRFQTEEGARQSVRAPRVQPGKDVRRPVNITGAPLVVQPPVVSSAAVAPARSAALAAPAAPALAAREAAPASPPSASAAPSAARPAPEAVASQPTTEAAPAVDATAPAASAPVAPSPAPAPVEHKDVTLDQETFEKTLSELLEKGTDRRVAEGQARRVALIAARKKAEG